MILKNMIYFSSTENQKSKIKNQKSKIKWHTINSISLRVAQCRYQ